jgi:outer membrane protease
VESFRKQETQKNHNHHFSEWLAGSDPDYHTAQDLYYNLAKRDGYMRSIGVDIGK